jgi:hypothetical protein
MLITIKSDVKSCSFLISEDNEIATLNIASNWEETSPVPQE